MLSIHPPWALGIVLMSVCLCCAGSYAAAAARLHVAMVQMPIEDGDLAGNMQRAETGIRQAAARKADLVCLPEAADFGWLYQEARRDALPIPGRYTDFLSKLAKELNVWIAAGCLEKDGDRTYNSAVLINRQGEIVLKHRKINTLEDLTRHLYDRGDPKDIKPADTEFGRIGLTICADNFDIENPKRLAEMGAWLLIAPHGFAAEPDKSESNAAEYQEHIRRVAKGTGMWVVGTDSVLGTVTGGAWKGYRHSGCSTIADPKGNATVVGKFLEPDLVICDIPVGK